MRVPPSFDERRYTLIKSSADLSDLGRTESGPGKNLLMARAAVSADG